MSLLLRKFIDACKYIFTNYSSLFPGKFNMIMDILWDPNRVFKIFWTDTLQGEEFAKKAFSKILQDPNMILSIFWTDEAHGDFKTHNCSIWRTYDPRECTKNLFIFEK